MNRYSPLTLSLCQKWLHTILLRYLSTRFIPTRSRTRSLRHSLAQLVSPTTDTLKTDTILVLVCLNHTIYCRYLNATHPTAGQSYYPTPPPSYPSPPPHYTHQSMQRVQHAAYDPSYSPSRFVQPPLNSASYGFPTAPQSTAPSHSQTSPFGRRNSHDQPPRSRQPVSDYSSLTGALDGSVGPSRIRSNVRFILYPPFLQPLMHASFTVDPKTRPRLSLQIRHAPALPLNRPTHPRAPAHIAQLQAAARLEAHRPVPPRRPRRPHPRPAGAVPRTRLGAGISAHRPPPHAADCV
jgi:hypothetical protein